MDFISSVGWIHPSSVGHWFSWNNKGVNSDGRASRIDHCFVNEEWIQQDFSTSVRYLNPHISDHCPLLVFLSMFLFLVVGRSGTFITCQSTLTFFCWLGKLGVLLAGGQGLSWFGINCRL